MDPNECLTNLLSAVREDDNAKTRMYAKTMEKWLEQGGYMPSISPEMLVMFCQSVDMLSERMIWEAEEAQRAGVQSDG